MLNERRALFAGWSLEAKNRVDDDDDCCWCCECTALPVARFSRIEMPSRVMAGKLKRRGRREAAAAEEGEREKEQKSAHLVERAREQM